MHKHILILLAVVSLFGCKLISKAKLGATRAKVQDEITTHEWLVKNRVLPDSSILMGLSPEKYIAYFENFGQGGGASPLIFSKAGNLFFYDGCTSDQCIKDLAGYIQTLSPNNVIAHSGIVASKNVNDKKFVSTSLTEFSDYLYLLWGPKAHIKVDSSKDYTLILPFAMYYGNKKQVTELRSFITAANSNKQSTFNFIFLSLDKLAWWGDDWIKRINISYN